MKTIEILKNEEKEAIKKIREKYRMELQKAREQENRQYLALGRAIADKFHMTGGELTTEEIRRLVDMVNVVQGKGGENNE